MTIKVPSLNQTAIISDDAGFAAQLSCLLATRNTYTAVLDGPRLSRQDRSAEVTRRHNAIARLKANRVLLAGLPSDAKAAMAASFSPKLCKGLEAIEEAFDLLATSEAAKRTALIWGRDRIGVGLLSAMRNNVCIEFSATGSPRHNLASISGHMVVCEEGDELSEVVAANYAFSLGAGLCSIPAIPDDIAAPLLEGLYSLHDHSEFSARDLISNISQRLRDLCPEVTVPMGGSITFITKQLPFGIAFPEVPTTHLYSYPDLGIAVINGLAKEQPATKGVGVAVLVDPGTTPAPEIAAAAKSLARRRMFVRGYSSQGATVRSISDMVHHFPYDILLFATHCGDSGGYRWIYEYTDREGIERRLVVDVAIGVANTSDENLFEVMQFTKFHSLDGVDWSDTRKKEKLYVGDAMQYYLDNAINKKDLLPISKENIDRVIGSAAMKMADNNYIAIPYSLANSGTPIVINNACVSWHELSKRFTFSGCRAYIGTLYPIMTSEAHDVVVKLLEKHFGKFLPHALWSAQREVYGEDSRRPYVMTGVYVQRLRVKQQDAPRVILTALLQAQIDWQTRVSKADQSEKKKLQDIVEYYRREIADFYNNWFTKPPM